MKINQGYPDPKANTTETSGAGRTQETNAVARGRAAYASAGAGKTDEVNVSSLASALQGALSDSPERAAYLEKLAGEYAAGAYQPDAIGTARGILDDTLGARGDEPAGTKLP